VTGSDSPVVTAPADGPYRGVMVRYLLLGLAAIVLAVVLISALVHVLYFGFLFLIAVAVGFLAVRIGRRSGRYR
jgi:hypothetical protein